MRIENVKAELILGDSVIVKTIIVSTGILSRMVGLLGRDDLPEGSAMLLNPCGSIHTVGMRFPLDVIFLDCNMCVVRTLCGLQANRFAFGGRGASVAIEMEAGWFDMSQVKNGDQLVVR